MQTAQIVRALLILGLSVLLIGDFSSYISRIFDTVGSSSKQAADYEDGEFFAKRDKVAKFELALKNSCLPKLICELNAAPEKDRLTPKARSLLQLIRDTSMSSSTAEVSSRYHFAAHMGQLIAGIDGTGCHNFYPGCPLPAFKVLNLLNKPSLL